MRFLSALMPRERLFFTLFNQHAQYVVEGSQMLVDLLAHHGDGDTAGRETSIRRIQDVEQAADKVTHETVALMHRTFVTPFDRDNINRCLNLAEVLQEDIVELTSHAKQPHDPSTVLCAHDDSHNRDEMQDHSAFTAPRA